MPTSAQLSFSEIQGSDQRIARGLGSKIAEEMDEEGLGTLSILDWIPLPRSDLISSIAIPMLVSFDTGGTGQNTNQMRSEDRTNESDDGHQCDIYFDAVSEGLIHFEPVLVPMDSVDNDVAPVPDNHHPGENLDQSPPTATPTVQQGSEQVPSDDEPELNKSDQPNFEYNNDWNARTDLGTNQAPASNDETRCPPIDASTTPPNSGPVHSNNQQPIYDPGDDNINNYPRTARFSEPPQSNANLNSSEDDYDDYDDGGDFDSYGEDY
ncbi:hypothetical protein PTTG_29559 [Puccinia triticina 1-1 BBBD Race 1]|uniref:Uncharacterized protein n=1 Tax=Puccinia triticina (isolate 1-1 / race 1 (BBBD)) TaxID=630390 RepID=A0A180G383_PUCT1|nr:hypothetical protein PTTG_29559 [Puccinia triticina 1-1 BBBD Race 1]